MKHTEGPWHWQPGRGVRQIKLKRDHWEVGVSVQGGKGIALVFGDDEANAALIAAAPDLYAACMAAAAWFSSDDSETSHELAESIEDQLNDAILKARGELAATA